MQITDYQIQNVLKVYRRQISRSHLHRPSEKGLSADHCACQTEWCAHGKRQAVIESVVKTIVAKLTRVKSQPIGKTEIVLDEAPTHESNATEADISSSVEFRFNVIDKDNRKTTASWYIEGSNLPTRGSRSWAVTRVK